MAEDKPPVAKSISRTLAEVYDSQIAQQLGIAMGSVKRSEYENEVKEEEFGRVEVKAVRRQDWDDNRWHLYIRFGDGGYECDPGVYSESKQNAIKEIEKAIEGLKKARAWIVNNVEGD